MKRISLSILVIGILLLSACGAPPAEFVVSNLQVTSGLDGDNCEYRITVDVENIGGSRGTYNLDDIIPHRVEGEPVEIELDPGEKQTVRLETEELFISIRCLEYLTGSSDQKEYIISVGDLSVTVTFPEPSPAKFILTNLQAIPAPHVSKTAYSVTVDIENVGGSKGIYQLTCKVDDEEMEPIEVELNPGEKRTVTLSEAQTNIRVLVVLYGIDEEVEQEHTISVDGLSTTITLTKPAYQLQLLSTHDEREYGYITMHGEVKNISDKSLGYKNR